MKCRQNGTSHDQNRLEGALLNAAVGKGLHMNDRAQLDLWKLFMLNYEAIVDNLVIK